MKTILCYGDSNTWGFMPKLDQPENDATNRYPWGVRWTSLLQMKLGEDYHVIEEGLNGRTTMFDCPMEDCRNGLREIDVSLVSHTPIDLVIIMLGTNDTKPVFNATAHIIAHGVERLVARVRYGGHGPGASDPKMLIVSPIRMGEEVEQRWLRTEFDARSLALDKKLAGAFRQVAENLHAGFLDAGATITADPADCIHMHEEGHAQLASMLYDEVKRMLG